MAREGPCYGEARPLNLIPQSCSPFIRKFGQISSPTELDPWRHKRIKAFSDEKDTSTIPWVYGVSAESKYKREKSLPDVIDYSDPFSISNLVEELDCGMYGSVCKDVEDLCTQTFQTLKHMLKLYPSLTIRRPDLSCQSPNSDLHTHHPLNGQSKEVSQFMDTQTCHLVSREIVNLEYDCSVDNSRPLAWASSAEEMQGYGCRSVLSLNACHESIGYMNVPNVDNGLHINIDRQVVIVDSDEEECGDQIGTAQASSHYKEVVLKKPIDEIPIKNYLGIDGGESNIVTEEQKYLDAEKESKKDEGVYVGVQDDLLSIKSSCQSEPDDLGDIWREMTLALECSKDATGNVDENNEDEEGEECDHSFLLKDDLGYVCRVCGVIKKSIETIFDFQWGKGSKSTRTYMNESRSRKEREENDAAPSSAVKGCHDLAVVEISVHPRHKKQMKTHQEEGFNFLVRNLISDNPGGCILAHAPGSGKTFMIISFIQSFLAKFPNARPLVILPKGILGTWKKEFIRWQVEDIPLYDFYSSKADSRKEQLDILQEWVEHKGILFLGYKQFANIVCKSGSNVDAACQDILLKVPSILILDEGHTPRNETTDVLHSLEKVRTPRKVVLSGTLFQNHVKEVFNILNLVRPKFLKSDVSKAIKKRVMSRGEIGRKHAGTDAAFFDVIEETLQNDENFKRKVAVIQDLRELTRNVLHYYKGDFLDELPGLVDLTVHLNLSPWQKHIVEKLKKMEKFKRTSIGTAVYVHPRLKELSENTTLAERGCNFNEDKLDELISRMDVKEGVKTKFFLNILGLCESSREKLLVFSQYLLPLKFLERLVVNTKGWSPGKEIFTINGDTSPEDRELAMEQFNNSSDAKLFFGSIKACGEGISLVGASRILIMDVHLNPSVTRQAIGRAFRPGQLRKVYAYRLVAADSPEEDNHTTSFRKELISKMWFEWSELSGNTKIEMENFNVKDSDDGFWGSPSLREDVTVVKKR